MTGIIIQYVLSPVIVAAMGYIVWLLQRSRKENSETAEKSRTDTEAMKKGTMLLLRRQIIADHNKYVTNGEPMPPYAFENFCETFETYKALGGNSMAEKMYEEVKGLHIGALEKK